MINLKFSPVKLKSEVALKKIVRFCPCLSVRALRTDSNLIFSNTEETTSNTYNIIKYNQYP